MAESNALVFDPRIYGGQAPSGVPVPTFTPPDTAAQAASSYVPPESVPADQIGKGTMSAAIGEAAIDFNSKPKASVGQSALTAVKEWSPVRVFDWITAPSFDVEPGFDPKPFVNTMPFVLTEGEQKKMAQSKSQAEAMFNRQQLIEQHEANQIMGDHPFVSGLIGIADPGYLMLDYASMGLGRVAAGAGAGIRTARALSFATAAGGAAGLSLIEQERSGISDKEVIFNALANGAGAALTLRGRKFAKVDPEFPDAELKDIVNRGMGREAEPIEKRVASEAQQVASPIPSLVVQHADDARLAKEFKLPVGTPENTSDARLFLGKYAADAEFGAPIRVLLDEHADMLAKVRVVEGDMSASKFPASYVRNNNTMYMPTEGTSRTAQVALHEAMHGLTVYKLQYGLENPQSAHGILATQLEGLRSLARQQLPVLKSELTDAEYKYAQYFLKNPEEFVAGLFSGNNGGLPKVLASIPFQSQGNLLTKMVDTVRKMVGLPPSQNNAFIRALGLTDDLMNTKLETSLMKSEGTSIKMYGAPTGTDAQMATTIMQREESRAEKLGQKISWSLYKTMSGYGDEAKSIARRLVDDPIDMAGDSAVSQRQAIRSDLAAHQYAFEDQLREEMAKQGAGLFKRIFQPRQSLEIQQRLEKQVNLELLRREQAIRKGLPADWEVDPAIKSMADTYDKATARALKEMQSAGVNGAEDIVETAGYAPRKWSVAQIEGVEEKLMRDGATLKQARDKMTELVAGGIRRANPDWEPQVARDVASAILSRARAKGYFEDAAFRSHVGNAGAKEVRDILKTTGISEERIQRAMDVITGVTDEANKMSNLKHRIDIDMNSVIRYQDGTFSSIADFLDTNVTRTLDNYLDTVAGQSALARKGLASTTDIDNLRTQYLHSIPREIDRAVAKDLFDNVINSLKGAPTGEALSDGMRKLQAVTQMVGLSSSGLWQVTEYANAMAKYGMLKTTREIARTMPGFKQLMGLAATDTDTATSLNRVLSRNSSQDIRIRPFIQKMEDNFEMPMGDAVAASLQQAKQVVPYLNAMRYVHHSQANAVGNLVAETFEKGARGDAKALAALEKYGLEPHIMDSIKADIQAAGMDTAKWSDGTWAKVRGPLSKMMDDAVLRNRTGEIPAFAQFSSVGKFIFTFRSFVLGAHNKVLAGTLGREGFAGMGLLLAYQLPLTVLAQATADGMANKKDKKEQSIEGLVAKSMGQMGAMGLFSELWGIASGDKQQFGSSGLMAIDRLYKTGGALAQGNFGTASASAITAVPILSILPGVRAFAETLKTDNTKDK